MLNNMLNAVFSSGKLYELNVPGSMFVNYTRGLCMASARKRQRGDLFFYLGSAKRTEKEWNKFYFLGPDGVVYTTFEDVIHILSEVSV